MSTTEYIVLGLIVLGIVMMAISPHSKNRN
jgi:hypothetical protein